METDYDILLYHLRGRKSAFVRDHIAYADDALLHERVQLHLRCSSTILRKIWLDERNKKGGQIKRTQPSHC